MPAFAFGAQTKNQEELKIKNITAETTHMTPESLKNLFDLRENDVFTEEKYQKAKEHLESLKIFKTLENNYTEHSGIGGILTYQFWNISMQISFNYTHNLNDSSHHIGVRIGGHF